MARPFPPRKKRKVKRGGVKEEGSGDSEREAVLQWNVIVRLLYILRNNTYDLCKKDRCINSLREAPKSTMYASTKATKHVLVLHKVPTDPSSLTPHLFTFPRFSQRKGSGHVRETRLYY